jgi:cytochrome c oxidase subunit 3
MREPVADHFEDLEQQMHAARLGMWVFLASEVLLFASLFALYAVYRAVHPMAFGEGVEHNPRSLGSINTMVLLCSSFSVALSVHMLREGKRRASVVLLALTVLAGALFLVIKGMEYAEHFHDGIFPGGAGAYFAGRDVGLVPFYTLYYGMTGLHAVHVFVGMTILSILLVRVGGGGIVHPASHPLELGAVYWHLVDVIWIFLWPLFYLTPGAAS